MPKCRGANCGAEIIFVANSTTKRMMPLNAEVVTYKEGDGKVTLVTDDGIIKSTPKPGDIGHIPHWATCPDAKGFEKKRPGRQ